MPSGVLNIIEPTLRSHDGHLSSLVSEFVVAHGGTCRVFADRDAVSVRIEGAEVFKKFPRRLRRVLLPFVYFRLMRRNEKVLVSTATTADFWAIFAAASLPGCSIRNFTLFVHWYRHKAKKDGFLRAFARRFPELSIMTPTHQCAFALRSLGFATVTEVPYPFRFGIAVPTDKELCFSSVLVAGGARRDKGFHQVCKLADYLSTAGDSIPMTIQVSGDHWGEYKADIATLVKGLRDSNFPHVRCVDQSLDPASYAALFRGAIVLQPYDPRTFSDRVSGVTLDALNACAPIIATRGTWTADIVERYNCGVVCDNTEPETLASAVREIHANYSLYRSRATVARDRMRQITESSPIGAILNRP